MPLFKCSGCGTIENTALAKGGYWSRNELNGGDPICCECVTGEWHGQFPKEPADPPRWVPDPADPPFLKIASVENVDG